MLVDSPIPSGPTRIADEPGVSGSEVLRLYDSPGGGFSTVTLIEEPMENPDNFDSDDSLSDFEDEDKGVPILA